jgi:hypothetical protein
VSSYAAPPRSSPWQTLARRDLEAVHALLEANHPGPVDRENAGFADWLERGYAQALGRARVIDSFGGYAATLAGFGAGFRDGHLTISTTAPERMSTPGFVVGLRAGALVVRESRVRQVPVGAAIIDCDGVPVGELLERDVYPFHLRGADIEATRTRAAPWLLVDDDNPFRKRPARCHVSDASGMHEAVLSWHSQETLEVAQALQRAAFGMAPKPDIRAWGKDGVWIAIPQFYGDAEYEAFLKRVIDQASSWREKRRVVFDLRGNTGGSSEWGRRMLAQLFGTERVDALDDAEPSTSVDWRVSPGNLEHMRKLKTELQAQFGAEAEMVQWADRVASGLAQSLAKKQPLWTQPSDSAAAPRTRAPAPSPPIPAAVFLLTDGRCASACLDFMTLALALPHVEHLGWPTAADSPYMEVRSETLPSTLARSSFAIKVYRNRARSNQVYEPKRRYSGEIADTAALERWIAELPLPSR